MNFNQNEKLKQVDEYTMIIGVDIASNLHYARAFDWRGFELGQVFKFENDIAGFKSFQVWNQNLFKRRGRVKKNQRQSKDFLAKASSSLKMAK